MIYKKSMVGVICALLATAALAAVSTATWNNATTNTDDSAIPASGPGSIATTTVEWSVCGPSDSFTTRAGAVTVPGTTRTAQTADLSVGRWCVRGFHTNTYGESSDPSNVVVRVVTPPKPRPPSGFSIS